MNRKIAALLLCFLMICVSFPGNVLADNNKTTDESCRWEIKVDKQGKTYFKNASTGEEMVQAFRIDENGNVVYLDLVEHANYLNSAKCIPDQYMVNSLEVKIEEEITPLFIPIYWDVYGETSSYVGIGAPEKVTADYRGPATISVLNAVTISETYGGGLSITASIKDAVKVGASFDWHKTLGSQTSTGGSWSVPSGRVGYIQFTPYLNVTVGYYMSFMAVPIFGTTILSEGEVWGASPKQLANGHADGLYEMILK